jgi:hypothetical protein
MAGLIVLDIGGQAQMEREESDRRVRDDSFKAGPLGFD